MKYCGTVAIVVMSMAWSAHADVVGIAGGAGSSIEGSGASFTGSLEYNFDGGTGGTLVVSLTNTTSGSVGGFLTGFVFNLDSIDAGASIAMISASDLDFLDTGAQSASPFGQFDAGAALSANWTGGGTPSNGMAVGVSETFSFAVNASDAGLLSASSFLLGDSDFAVRFRGLLDGGSDKVLTPTPGTAGVAMLGLFVVARRKRS